MTLIIHIRTPADPEPLRTALRKLCSQVFDLRLVGEERGELGPRNIIRLEFANDRDHARLHEALRLALAVTPRDDEAGNP